MFKLFNKGGDSKELSPEYLALIKKWDLFLEKMVVRFDESLISAEEAIMENLSDSDYDLTPTLRAWQGIKSSLQDLSEKIDTTFDEKVAPKMLEHVERHAIIDEDQKGVQIGEGFLEKIERFEIVLEGKVSKVFYDHAFKHLNADFQCTQCSAKLEVRKDIFRAHYVNCDYCNTVNTFTPNDKIVQIRWIADNIAKHNAITEWDIMKKANADFNRIRSPHDDQDKTEYIAGFKNRENTERSFWSKYFNERSVLLPEYKETIDHDVDVKMKWFYEERKRELNF